jgi:septal ring factor EnvC (AmiA/AmiB activator)
VAFEKQENAKSAGLPAVFSLGGLQAVNAPNMMSVDCKMYFVHLLETIKQWADTVKPKIVDHNEELETIRQAVLMTVEERINKAAADYKAQIAKLEAQLGQKDQQLVEAVNKAQEDAEERTKAAADYKTQIAKLESQLVEERKQADKQLAEALAKVQEEGKEALKVANEQLQQVQKEKQALKDENIKKEEALKNLHKQEINEMLKKIETTPAVQK